MPFARKYTATDVALLVEMDRANEDVCGPAIVHLLHRAFVVYGDQRYERLSKLSVSHLYNLRKTESPRILRRLQPLRRWSHEQEIKSFFP